MRSRFLSAILTPILLLVLCVASAHPVQAQTTASKSKAQPAAKAPEPGDEYPRPAKPAKQYTIGVLIL